MASSLSLVLLLSVLLACVGAPVQACTNYIKVVDNDGLAACAQACLNKTVGICPVDLVVRLGGLKAGTCGAEGFYIPNGTVSAMSKAGPCGELVFLEYTKREQQAPVVEISNKASPAAVPAFDADDILLTPPNEASCPSCPALAVVWVPGASIPVSAYKPIVQGLQNSSALKNFRVWAAVAHCPAEICLNAAPPLPGIRGALERVYAELQGNGVAPSRNLHMPAGTPLVAGGHSLGGAMLQQATLAIKGTPSSPLHYVLQLQVLTGSFITRNTRSAYYTHEPQQGVPTLTLGGELDGMCRITRMAEERYHTVSPMLQFPVIGLLGFDHMSFASGTPPAFVHANDLRAEIDTATAHAQIASLASDFILANLKQDTAAGARLQSAVQASDNELMNTILLSMQKEGSQWLKPWCQTALPPTGGKPQRAVQQQQQARAPTAYSGNCWIGCPWNQEVSAPVMAGFAAGTVKVDDADAFHYVWDVTPVHLPEILNNCSAPTSACTLKTTSITQAIYKWEDGYVDSGFFREAATELRTKLPSRQAMWLAAGKRPAEFNETDKSMHNCADINAMAYRWALQNAPQRTRDRFTKFGEPMVMGEDQAHVTGPTWIWSPLQYNKGKTAGGEPAVVVQSPSMSEPMDSLIKAAAGKHYCKVLSPAYALEWLLIDGLRLRLGDSSQNRTSA